MNSIQTSIYAMFLRTQKVLDNNKAVWTANTKFTANYTAFAANLGAIGTEQKQQGTDKTGITKDKEVVKENLVELAATTASGIRSYAADVNNRELEETVKLSQSKLDSLAEVKLINTCEVIHTQGTKNVAALAEYGVTAAVLTELKTLTDKYKAMQPNTRLAINTGSLATGRLRTLITATGNLLKRQLDTKMPQYKKSHSDFYNAYFQARNIIEQGADSKKEEKKV
jgi:hypothetical protein